MRVIGFLLYLGGGMFILLGSLHALYTFLDIRRPRRLVPQDAALALEMTKSHVRLARGGTTMWRAWVGFNFSHSLGAIIFGVLCCFTGTVIGTMALPAWVLFIFVVIGWIYLGLSVLYWFRIPTAGIALGVACLSAAWVMYAFAGIWCARC